MGEPNRPTAKTIMYIIIGGDQKEYGPITADDVRKWIAEGRLNAQSLMKAESDAEFRPLSAFPEFAGAFGTHAPVPDAPPGFATSANFLERDYELDIGGCISRGWSLTTSRFGQLFVPVLIYFLIEIAFGAFGKIPFIGPLFSIANLFVSGPLMAGVFYIFILVIRGRPAELGVMFDGFRRGYWQLFLGYLVPALFYLACMIPFLIIYMMKVMPILAQFQHEHANPADIQNNLPEIMSAMKSVLVGSLPVFLICMIPVTYLSVSLQFTLPLVIDKKIDFWTAMKASWTMVHKHWWSVFGVVVVIGLINIAGVIACCVGLLFTIPLGFAVLMYVYETIFGETQTR
jgi:uncharacterized membrane protein